MTAPWTAGPYVAVYNARAFGARGDGVADDTLAIQAAIDSSVDGSGSVYLPKGTYRITASLSLGTLSAEAPGIVVLGDGPGRTIVKSAVENGFAIVARSTVSGNFQLFGAVRGVGIEPHTGSWANSGGISIESAWLFHVEGVRVVGVSGDGIRVDSPSGESDAPIAVTISRSQIKAVGGIGINITTPSGSASISSVAIRDVLVELCAQGGLSWQGQVAVIENLSTVVCGGFGGLRIPHNGVTCQALHVKSYYSENNIRDLIIEAGLTVKIENMQIVHNEGGYSAWSTNKPPFVEIGKADQVSVRNMVVDRFSFGVASNYTPATGFLIHIEDDTTPTPVPGVVTGLELSHAEWQIYDASGQVRYAYAGGATPAAVNQIRFPKGAQTVPLSTAVTATRGGTPGQPIGNGDNDDVEVAVEFSEYEAIFIASPTADFALTGLKNRFLEDGRRIRIVNQTSHTMTLKHNNGASAAGNRFLCKNGGNLAVPLLGQVELVYSPSAWWVLATS